MNKILLIAKRDYLQIVQSKAYLIAILLPLLFGGGSYLVNSASGRRPSRQHVEIVDHTGVSAAAVIQAMKDSGHDLNFGEAQPGETNLVLDISADAVHYSTNAGIDQIGAWLPRAVNAGLHRVRLTQFGLDPARIAEALHDVPVTSTTPASQTVVPIFMVVLLVMVVLLGAAPHLSAVAEDKMQRVFEMLLASATPLQLMAGKVLAALGAALTTSSIYVVGGLMALTGMAAFGLAPLDLLPWLFLWLVIDAAMLSAMGIALGSSCNSPQEAQSLVSILFTPVIIPLLLLRPVIQQPNGPLAVTLSFLPPFTPVLMFLRQALPGGVPWWQPWLGLIVAILWAAATIWAAARIFRVGILAQGKAPKLAELAQWVIRG